MAIEPEHICPIDTRGEFKTLTGLALGRGQVSLTRTQVVLFQSIDLVGCDIDHLDRAVGLQQQLNGCGMLYR